MLYEAKLQIPNEKTKKAATLITNNKNGISNVFVKKSQKSCRDVTYKLYLCHESKNGNRI